MWSPLAWLGVCVGGPLRSEAWKPRGRKAPRCRIAFGASTSAGRPVAFTVSARKVRFGRGTARGYGRALRARLCGRLRPRRGLRTRDTGLGRPLGPRARVTQIYAAAMFWTSSWGRAKRPFVPIGVVASLRPREWLSGRSRAWQPAPGDGAGLHRQCNLQPSKTLLKQLLRGANHWGLPIVLPANISHSFGNNGICKMCAIPG